MGRRLPVAVKGSVGAGLKNPSSVNKAIYFLCRKPFFVFRGMFVSAV